MIRPKYDAQPRPTKAQESDAYELATIRDNNTCQRCRRDCGPIARDHRKNRSQGGLTTVANIQILGLGCHQHLTEHPEEAFREGWAVPSYGDPTWWPARRYLSSLAGLRLTWVIYGDDGSVTEISAAEARKRMNGGAS